MIRQIIFLIALLTAYAYLSLGQGALGALLLHAGPDFGFSDTFLGSLISIMYLGFIVGKLVLRHLLPRVTYIRTYAICAAVMGICVLLFPLLKAEIAWIVLRFGYGLFFFTAVVLMDSWLNSIATPTNRSRLLGAVWTFNFIAYGVSQYILLLADADILMPFILVSITFILSLVPMCLTRVPEPVISDTSTSVDLSFKAAYKIAPISMIGQFFHGMAAGAAWLFIRYAQQLTDNIEQASTLAVFFFGSGFLLQYFIGSLSDKVKDRRIVMAGVYLVSAISAGVLFFGQYLPYIGLLIVATIFGSVFVTMYALNVAYGQDFVDKNDRANYSARIFQIYAAGALLGPLIAGSLMENFSTAWLFGFITCIMIGMLIVSLADKILPRYMPAKPAEFNFADNYSAGMVNDNNLYNELDIGPIVPEDSEQLTLFEQIDTVQHHGPILPDTTDEDSKQEIDTVQHHGPILPDTADEDSKQEIDTMQHHGPILPDTADEDSKQEIDAADHHGPTLPEDHIVEEAIPLPQVPFSDEKNKNE